MKLKDLQKNRESCNHKLMYKGKWITLKEWKADKTKSPLEEQFSCSICDNLPTR